MPTPSLGTRTSIYQPEQPGLKFPEEPAFNSPEELRLYRQKHLVAACRAFADWGFDYGFAGHLTIRDPERLELYWTNPMAVHFRDVRLSNLILVDHDGQVVEGDHAVNRAGFVLHAAVHAANAARHKDWDPGEVREQHGGRDRRRAVPAPRHHRREVATRALGDALTPELREPRQLLGG